MSNPSHWSMLGYCPEPDIVLVEDYLQSARATINESDRTVKPTYILRVHMDLEVTEPAHVEGLRKALQNREVETVIDIVKEIRPDVAGTAGEAVLRAALMPKPEKKSG